MTKNEIQTKIKALIAEVEALKDTDSEEMPTTVRVALFSSYVQLNESLFRLITGKRSKDIRELNEATLR